MKLKKLLALACSLVMGASMLASTAIVADAAVEGVSATLEFAGYEVKGTTTFAKINVKATIPDTLVPYEMVAADWETTFEDTYKGKMIQAVGFDIPNVAGLTYVGSLSSCANYVQLQNNTADNKVTIYTANTGAYDTYYAGAVDTLATLYYRITGAVDGTYEVALTDAVIKMVEFTDPTSSTPAPKSYTFNDFTVTNATVKPEVEEEEKTEWTSEDNAAIAADKKIVAHSENVTGVTADSKVTVTVDGESKTFGNGLGAYFAEKGIDLEGVADLAFRFAVLVDKAVESVSFVIE